ncbi:MAG: hypothetical protein HS113_02060 [Verrucomicrobiales bacterium]|nr:hypothetical protein [Verrucomicrobiales bacterium]
MRGKSSDYVSLGGAGLILLLVAGHVAWQVEPTLRYHELAPPFFLESPTWAKALEPAGGVVRQAGAGLAQFNVSTALGTLVFTGLLGALLWAARSVLVRVDPSLATAVACVPVVLVASLTGRYVTQAEQLALAMLLALLAANVWMRLPTASAAVRIGSFWGLTGLVFWLGGPAPVFLLVAVGLAGTLAVNWQPKVALGCAAALVILPLWRWHWPAFNPWAFLADWGKGWSQGLAWAAWSVVPIWMAIRGGLNRRAAASAARVEGLFARWLQGKFTGGRRWIGWAAGGGATLLFLWLTVDRPRKAIAQVSLSATRGDWTRALTAAGRVSDWPARTYIEASRALFHEGRLLTDLFTFPQRRGRELLPDFRDGLEMSSALSATLFELGQVNLAEHLAHEVLELEGPRPPTLRLLARIHVLLHRPEAARVFLNRLRRVPFCREEADEELARLRADPAGDLDPQLALLRGRMPRTDEPEVRLPADRLLRQLLAANPTNRMAFEYLVAHHLLAGQPTAAVDAWLQWQAPGKPGIPRLVEEALLVVRSQTRDKTTPLRGGDHAIHPVTLERYRQFLEALRPYADRTAEAHADLAHAFGDTFWFYLRFGDSVAACTPTKKGAP